MKRKNANCTNTIRPEAITAFAYAEPQARYDWADLKTTARKDGSAYVLNGHKAVVRDARCTAGRRRSLRRRRLTERRSVVVTGASRGLGRATAAHLHRAGWTVLAAMRAMGAP